MSGSATSSSSTTTRRHVPTRRSGATARRWEIPDTLARKIDIFRNAGRLYREDEDLFAEVSWLQVLLGQGIEPATHHPLADNLTERTADRLPVRPAPDPRRRGPRPARPC
jgi:hypothetical protein